MLKRGITAEVGFAKELPVGYTAYWYSFNRQTTLICKWWAYPVCRLFKNMAWYRDALYRYLNEKGIMETEIGCISTLNDIKSVSELRKLVIK